MLDLHTINMPKLQEEDCNQEAIRKAYRRQEGKIAVENLKKE